MANDCIPIYTPGGTLTCYANVAVTGKRFVAVVSDALSDPLELAPDSQPNGNFVVGLPAAGGKALGVIVRDVALHGMCSVLCTPGEILPVKSAADIDVWEEVQVDAQGRVVPLAAGEAVGIAMTSSLSGEDAIIKIYGLSTGSGSVAPQAAPAALVDNSGGAAADGTIAAIAAPTDAPATADALRDDIAATMVPAINGVVKELATQVNLIRTKLIAAGIFT